MMMTKDLEMMTTCLHLRKWKGLLMRPPRWRRLIRSRVARYEFALGCGHFVTMNSVGVHHCVCNMGCPKKPIHTFRPVQGQKSWDGHVGIFCISSAIQYYIRFDTWSRKRLWSSVWIAHQGQLCKPLPKVKAALADKGSDNPAHHAPAYRGFHSFCQATKAPQASRTAAWNLHLRLVFWHKASRTSGLSVLFGTCCWLTLLDCLMMSWLQSGECFGVPLYGSVFRWACIPAASVKNQMCSCIKKKCCQVWEQVLFEALGHVWRPMASIHAISTYFQDVDAENSYWGPWFSGDTSCLAHHVSKAGRQPVSGWTGKRLWPPKQRTGTSRCCDLVVT